MEEKLRKLMKHEGINSTRLAEMLSIQASGISHIMSGRNKPSFDFIVKLLVRFPQINPDWLLMDKGPMYRSEVKGKTVGSHVPDPALPPQPTGSGGNLFSTDASADRPSAAPQTFERDDNDIIPSTASSSQPHTAIPAAPAPGFASASSIERIVVFFKDKTFTEYQPG